jgi:hypothetical protein
MARYSTAIMRAVRASVTAVGAAYAEMEELKPKHGIKQFVPAARTPSFRRAEGDGSLAA